LVQGLSVLRQEAEKNKVEYLVGAKLKDAFGSGFLDPDWESALASNEQRVQALIEAASDAMRGLRVRGFRFAVVEGGGTLLSYGLPCGGFQSGDLDVLVGDEREMRVIYSHLREIGLAAECTKPALASRSVFDILRDGIRVGRIEVSPEPFDRAFYPLLAGGRHAVWLARSVPSRRSPDLSVLDATDAVVQACIHTSLHSYVRSPGVRLYVDIDEPACRGVVDWSRLVEEAFILRMPTRIFVSLAIAADLLGTPIPRWVLAALCPSEARLKAIRLILGPYRVFRQEGFRPFPVVRAPILDAALDDRGPTRWLRDAVYPPTEWLRPRFRGTHWAQSGRAVMTFMRYAQTLGVGHRRQSDGSRRENVPAFG
jgi:hypothetical protein